MPESFEALLVDGGLVALRFHAIGVDPLPIFIDTRGDFPPIQVRNGSVSPIDDRVGLRIEIGEGTEIRINGAGYMYKSGQWNEM
jgi:hypothetical protein